MAPTRERHLRGVCPDGTLRDFRNLLHFIIVRRVSIANHTRSLSLWREDNCSNIGPAMLCKCDQSKVTSRTFAITHRDNAMEDVLLIGNALSEDSRKISKLRPALVWWREASRYQLNASL
ncbi:hypothetical protein E2C01_030228 [Portunus trituberculatus]|uniref:Uncharacterized protein n=1 Tax=Portunus trituberculatus TaxID=210409 RepID=A0A5B7EPW7_PORTR|nr:hypothetical protein [Portunus trituberculatus]